MSLRKQYLMGCISLLFIKISLAFISYAFNPSKELAKAVPNGFHFTFFYFFTVNLFLSPVGRCVEYSVAVQLRLFPYIEFWEEWYSGFQTPIWFIDFFLLRNVLSPEGRCEAYPVGVQLRLFPFIEFWVRNGILEFKNQ